MQGTGVDHGSNVSLATQRHEVIRVHGRFAPFIEIDDGPLVQEYMRHFHPADRAFDDLRAGGDDSPGLLALKHGGGGIRGVGEMGYAGFGHLNPTDGAAGLDLGLQPLGS